MIPHFVIFPVSKQSLKGMKRWTWHDVIGTWSAQLQSRFSFGSLPIPARVPTLVKATVGITPSQRKVYGMVWERRPWDRTLPVTTLTVL